MISPGRVDSPAACLLESLLAPIAERAMRDLGGAALLSMPARESLRGSLEKRLGHSGRQAFSWYWKVFLTTPGLRTTHPEELRALFFTRGVEAETERFLDTFPGLKLLWTSQVAAWQAFVTDFLQHASAFSQGRPVCEILPDLSDPHNGGRTVLRVRFGDDSPWFYKPRSGENEKAWFELLRWLNEQGISRPFRLLEIVSAADHCWAEAVETYPCRSREEVVSFYHRAGALLYLSFVLGGVDLHCDNVVAAGEHPVFVDCETLFHEPVSGPGVSPEREKSLLRCGLLPTGRPSVSGFGATETGAHTVWWEDRAISAGDFAEEIVAGFEETHHLVSRSPQQAAFRKRAEAMSRLSWRKIARPTARYDHFLEQSLAATALLQPAGRRAVLKTLNNDFAVNENQAAEEVHHLEKGDIPFFHGPGYFPDFRWEEDSPAIIRRAFGQIA